jgi:tartrate-resistant acid phosphatase type 5
VAIVWLLAGGAAGAGCFDPADVIEVVPEPICPMSLGLPRGARAHKPEGGTPSRSAPPDGGPDDGALEKRVQFAVIGDFGLDGENEGRVADLVASWNPDFVITTGDNNYYNGEASTIDRNIGKYYCQFIGNYLGEPDLGSAHNRFWPSPGNHDWLAPGLKPYLDYFTLPGNERYYDVARGLVHLYALDSDFSEPDGVTENSVQGAWLRDALSASTSCFDVVFFHHPPYSSGPHGSTFDMRWSFEAWGADVVIAGHDHVYERFQVGALPYFTVGLGGAAAYDFVTTLPETRMQYKDDYGAMRVTADPHGITFEFVNAKGAVVDLTRIDKECARRPLPRR